MEKLSTVLMIDPDRDMRRAVQEICGSAGINVEEAASACDGLAILAKRTTSFDAIVLEPHLPDSVGDEALQRVKHLESRLPVLVLTADGSIPGALRAVRSGAFDYLTKPLRGDELIGVLKQAIAQSRAERRGHDGLRSALAASMGHSDAIWQVVARLENVIASDYSVLILGETGTGKELVARALHEHGPRRDHPFVAVDCGALVDGLVDSEFFGHEKGAFTGAIERRRGRFELAAGGGTLFLDEIGNLSQVAQRTLLRALESRTVYRVGGTAPVQVDLRVVAATNESLDERIAAGSFRADLYFRLAEYTVSLPPLRARPEDIEFLARRFLGEACGALRRPPVDITNSALALLRGYDWPGNVRELRNVLRRAALSACGAVTPSHIAEHFAGRATNAIGPGRREGMPIPHQRMQDRIRAVERGAILDALAQAGGNKAEAARILNIDYKTFRTKLKAFAGRDNAPRTNTQFESLREKARA